MSKRIFPFSIHVPCVSQRFVMCALAVSGATIGWMMYYSAYNTYKEVVTNPFEPQTKYTQKFLRGKCFNTRAQKAKDVTRNKKFARVYWSLPLQKGLLHAFWLSYSISSVASGIVADVFGPKHVWGLGSFLSAVSCCLLPLFSTINPFAALVDLVLSGLGFGVMSSCSSVLVAHWAPENERTIFVAFIESAMLVGLIIDLVLHSRVTMWGGGWEKWLYVSCASSAVWIVAWYIIFYNRPSQHPRMPPYQLQYLQTRTPGIQSTNILRDKRMFLVPWKNIFISLPFLSLFLYNLATAWIHSFLFYQMNPYLLKVFNDTSILVPGCHVTGMALGTALSSLLIHGWISDKLISSGLTSRTTNRRLFLIFPNYLSVCLLFSIPWLECKKTWVVMALFLLTHVQGIAYAPLCANVVDLSPRYAGSLRGLLAASRAIVSVFCRRSVEFIVEEPADYNSWSKIYQLSAAILLIFSSPYLCFGSGNIQKWNYYVRRREPERVVNLENNPSRNLEPTRSQTSKSTR